MIGRLMACGQVRFQMHFMRKMSGGHTSVLEYTMFFKKGLGLLRETAIRPGILAEVINLD